MAFNAATTVQIGNGTRKSDYDRLRLNDVALASADFSFHGEKTFHSSTVFHMSATFDGTVQLQSATTTYFAPVSGEPSGGTWHPVENPSTDWFGSKTAGWTADQFTPGGWELDFSSIVPAGTKAVRCLTQFNSIGSDRCFARKAGDTNISNTPQASSEYAAAIAVLPSTYLGILVVYWLSNDYKVEIAVQNDRVDISIGYPRGYMI